MKAAALFLAALPSCAFVPPAGATTWVAVGDVGTIVRSTDGGMSWTGISSPVGDQLHGVAFRGGLGLAVGVGGRVLRSTDAGASWTVVARPTTETSGVTEILQAVSFTASGLGIAVGAAGTILRGVPDAVTGVGPATGSEPRLGLSILGNAG